MNQPGLERLMVVSNRLPVQTLRVSEGRTRLEPGGGGLVAAMRPVLERTGGLWIGWPGEAGAGEVDEQIQAHAFEIVPVPLDPRLVEGYYDGFSNRTLWPLFHDLLGRASFEPAWWAPYQEANRAFAEVAAGRACQGDVVWVHDYHLILFGEYFRRLRPEIRQGFFLHIPFPPLMLFHRLPWRKELMRGLLSYDLVGFQTERDLGAFVRALLEVCPEAKPLEFTERQASLEWEGRTIEAGVFPISIDFAYWDALGKSRVVRRKAQRFIEKNASRKIILGVDRLDYSKGIPQRLRAFGQLLEHHPAECERVQFLQIAVPSRTSVSEYKELKREIDALIGNINGRFATPTWIPINYIYRSFAPADLAAYYRAADVALVTPIKDGMNLVAKEFVAASVEKTGVLILSEFAGAAYELEPGAIIVNPHDVAEVAEALYRALHMPQEEQRSRLESLRSIVSQNDVHRWAQGFLCALRGIERKFRSPSQILKDWTGWRAPGVLVYLDYDGALSPLRLYPNLAAPDPDVVKLLSELALDPGIRVVVASGRSFSELDRWFSDPEICLVSGHGSIWRHRGVRGLLLAQNDRPEGILEARRLLDPIVEATPGAALEDKGVTLAVHYRMVPEFVLPRLLPRLRKEIEKFVEKRRDVALLEGACVLEIVPEGVSRGKAFSAVRAKLGCENDPALLIGLDRREEELIEALGEGDLAVHVGGGPTRAAVALRRPQEVKELLSELLKLRAAEGARENMG